jgi:Leucine-rich repeat (LRR) protein
MTEIRDGLTSPPLSLHHPCGMKSNRAHIGKTFSRRGRALFIVLGLAGSVLISGCSPDSAPPPRNPQRATTMREAMEAPDQVLELDLYYRRLPAFPGDILKLGNLERLSVRTCKIGSFPDGIGTLSKLVSLDAGESSLTNITPAVGCLTNLCRVWLNDNQLTELPSELGQLSKLTYLNLDRNQLTALPDTIGRLANLTWLRVNHNRLTALPADLSGLAQNLKTLYLMGNPIPANEQTRIRNALPNCKVIFK